MGAHPMCPACRRVVKRQRFRNGGHGAAVSRFGWFGQVDLGHRRWAIENQGFNGAVDIGQPDHVYHHEPRAMEVILLREMLACNRLRVFCDRNLEPVLRDRVTRLHICERISADLYAVAANSRVPP